MPENIVLQLIISGSSVILSILGVLLILAKKLSNPENGATMAQMKSSDNGLQRQINSGSQGTTDLTKTYDRHIEVCTERWMCTSKFEGKIEGYMEEIRGRLTKIEGNQTSMSANT